MKIKPKINVIIPYKYNPDTFRQEALKKVMECIEEQKESVEVNLIITEQIGEGEEGKFPYPCDIHYSLQSNKPFNKSWILNYAIKESGIKDFIVLDADNIFEKDFFKKICDFSKNCKCFFCANKSILEAGRDNPEERVINFTDKNAMMGCWYSTTDVFWNSGGMNENYFGYGAEDNDIYWRIYYTNSQIEEMEYTLRHCYHHWAIPPAERLITMEVTHTYPHEIIKRLKELNLGQKEQPTLVDIKDLIERLKKEFPDDWKKIKNIMAV